jgi:hypothetical protein
MKEITKKVYVSDDGKEFNSKEECIKHEQERMQEKISHTFFKMTNDIYKMCQAKSCQRLEDASYCPFYVYNAEIKESCCLFRICPHMWKTVTTYQGEYCSMPLIKED